MKIKLTYTATKGTKEHCDFDSNVLSIDLHGKQISQIDLAPLYQFINLQKLDLSNNQIQFIDLSPLSSGANFLTIDLTNNHLSNIEVPSDRINITCDSKTTTHSWFPIANCVYDRPTNMYPWPFLQKMAKNPKADFRTLQDILAALGLKEYGFIDKKMRSKLISIPQKTPIQDVKEKIRRILRDSILYALDGNGATTGLVVENVARYHPEIAIRMQDIIKLRTAEIEQVSIKASGDTIDLRELWLTAYGYEILSALKMRCTTNRDGLQRIKAAMSEAGLELKTGNIGESSVQMSLELKKAIWWIVKKRGTTWVDVTSEQQRVISRFSRYLNGPMGKTVLNNLSEGESFILQTSEHSLRITKRNGHAVVSVAEGIQNPNY